MASVDLSVHVRDAERTRLFMWVDEFLARVYDAEQGPEPVEEVE